MTKYSKEKLFEFIKHDALISLYNNPLLKEKQDEIYGSYSYFFNADINKLKEDKPLLIVNQEKAESLYNQVFYDLAQSFGLNYFTNADKKTKELSDILIHTILCDNDEANRKIKALVEITDNPVLVTFKNVDTASPEVINSLMSLIQNKPSNIFMGFEANKPTNLLQKVHLMEVDNTMLKKAKMIKIK